MRIILFTSALLVFSGVSSLEPFTLDEFLLGTYSDIKWNGTWLSDTEILFRDELKNYKLFDVTKPTVKPTTFLPSTALTSYNVHSITVSKDRKLVLVKYDVKPVYRHSTTAKFAVLNLLNANKPVELPADIKNVDLQTCRFSLNSNSLIVVKDNNIFYVTDLQATPVLQQITTNGEPRVVYNGVPDWIYEEEVIGDDSTLWPSPKSEKFVFAKFNDKTVKEFQYPIYGTPGDYKDQYPKWTNIRYPKVGTKNPTFSVHAFDPIAKKQMDLQLSIKDSTQYVLYGVVWKTAEVVVVTYTNRVQNEVHLEECNVGTGKCTEVEKRAEPAGWLDILPLEIVNESRIVEAAVSKGFDVFNVIRSKSDIMTFPLGNMTISKILGNNGADLYFEGTVSSQHAQQHVYRVNLSELGSLKCLTCDFIVANETCKYARGELSSDKNYMTRICSGPGPTYADIVNLKNEKSVKVWLDNADLRALLKNKYQPIIKDVFYDIPQTKFKAAVRLVLPPGMSESKKYPMLVNVYAGPNSNQISDAYSIGLQHYLVTNKNYIYAFIDGRGSGKRGRDLMHQVYTKLGVNEIDDQITVTKMLRDNFSFIDKEKIGIWGWSYGGFATAHVIARDSENLFKCGVSVAPVTDFIYYDSIYTERYMGLYDPKNEADVERYNQTDVTAKAKQFVGKNYLLVHGNADDNVHFQQAMQLARALELADVPFEQMSYPDEAHSLGGVKKHLYHMLEKYWAKHFDSKGTKGGAEALATLSTMCREDAYKAICCVIFKQCA